MVCRPSQLRANHPISDMEEIHKKKRLLPASRCRCDSIRNTAREWTKRHS